MAVADSLDDIPVAPSSQKTPDEIAAMRFFEAPSQNGDSSSGGQSSGQPQGQSRFDWKFIGVAVVLFLLLANPWADSLIGKIPKCEGALAVTGIKGLLFLLLLIVAVYVMKK